MTALTTTPVITLPEEDRADFVMRVYQHVAAAVAAFVAIEALFFMTGVAEAIAQNDVATDAVEYDGTGRLAPTQRRERAARRVDERREHQLDAGAREVHPRAPPPAAGADLGRASKLAGDAKTLAEAYRALRKAMGDSTDQPTRRRRS